VNVGPSGEITALQLGFGALVPLDTLEVPVRVQTSAGGLTYPFPVAGMLPWMCLKSDALVFRDKPKDGYDIVWLVAGLGPEVVADEVTWSPVLTSDHRERAIAQLNLLITDQFADVDSVGPVSYATFMEAPDDPSLRRYALEAVRTFGAALSGSGI
jgi:hypothetical protein